MKMLLGLMALFLCWTLPACSTLQAAPSMFDQGESPRRTAVAGAQTTIDVLDKVTAAAQLDLLSKSFLENVVKYAPVATDIAAGYLDATSACVVLDGSLQTDPATGKGCDKSMVKRAFNSLVAALDQVADLAGADTDTGRALVLASIMLKRQLQPASGDVVTGYEKRPDVPLAEYNATRDDLRAAKDRLLAAATAALAKRSG